MDPAVYTVLRLPPARASASEARRHVAETLEEWGRPDLVDEAVLCASELATNAVLHSRDTFDITVRPAGDGVRVEVIDGRPRELPMPFPTTGSALDVTGPATTGRGLLIVAALATRWGYTATVTAKSVWAELSSSHLHQPDPVVVVDPHGDGPPGPIRLHLRSMPVRTAVASGVQVDELVREIQLRPSTPVDDDERTHLFDLLDRSNHPRLAGRYAALRAAGRDEPRYDLELATTVDALRATGELAAMLLALGDRLKTSVTAVTPAVARFRAWAADEVLAQTRGATPTVCPLDDDPPVA
jgi:anti-sigma regulatory factor (Ser/Thr protein kinase)